MTPPLTQRDLEQIERRGIEPREIERQLELLRQPPRPTRLERPCTVGDGVRRLECGEHAELEDHWRRAERVGRLQAFVPASGAATRMLAFLDPSAPRGESAAADRRRLLASLAAFPFAAELEAAARRRGHSLAALGAAEDADTVAALLLEDLGLARLPKALMPFHAYPDGTRTALEEHLAEAPRYLSAGERAARIHFTVAAAHRARVERFLEGHRAELERRAGLTLAVGLSLQDPITDTVAVDADGRPVRRGDGRLLFRPAGHGALIHNLDRLAAGGADLVYVKNIDNVSRAANHELTALWKRLLGGYLVRLEAALAALLARLEAAAPPSDAAIEEIARRLASELAISPPVPWAGWGAAARRRWLAERLARPLRVCGVVVNAGEPGGGPFWVRDGEGTPAGQIVEPAQVDLADAGQRAAWRGATHFNPVDLVLAPRGPAGRGTPLGRWIDPAMSFVATKQDRGRAIRVLERPGLWNGAMAGWNTVFVEVPAATFTPVKTLLDLVRPDHRPAPDGAQYASR